MSTVVVYLPLCELLTCLLFPLQMWMSAPLTTPTVPIAVSTPWVPSSVCVSLALTWGLTGSSATVSTDNHTLSRTLVGEVVTEGSPTGTRRDEARVSGAPG